jgi:signal transduction histidine kinase
VSAGRGLEARLRTWGWGGFAVLAGAYAAALVVLLLLWESQTRAIHEELEAYTTTESVVLSRLLLYDLASDPRVWEAHRLELLLRDAPKGVAGGRADEDVKVFVRANLDWPDTEIWKRAESQFKGVKLSDISAARREAYEDMLEERLAGIRDDLWARVTFSDNLRGVVLKSDGGAEIGVGQDIPADILRGPAEATRLLSDNRLLVTLPLTVQANRWGTAYLLVDRGIVVRLSESLMGTLRKGMWALLALLVLMTGAWTAWWSVLLRRVRREVVAPIVGLAHRMEERSGGDEGGRRETSEPEWLSEAFDRLMDRLAQQREQLLAAQKLGLMERVGAGLSHEINNALNPARLRLDELAMEGRAPGREDILALREYLAHAQQVLKDLTFAVKRPSGPLRMLRPHEWLSVARRLTDPALQGLGGLDWRAGDEGPEVYGEPQWLVQVAVNLLLNARDAASASPGGGHVRVGLEAGADGTVLFTIADDGPGIDPQVAGHLFEPYVTSKPKGSGLGLFVVDQLVRRMEGTVALRTGASGGTVAEVRLRGKMPSEVDDGGR